MKYELHVYSVAGGFGRLHQACGTMADLEEIVAADHGQPRELNMSGHTATQRVEQIVVRDMVGRVLMVWGK